MKKKLHVVFKTHLDIGFTDLAEKVTIKYLDDFIPRALTIGEALPKKFVWTTGSWLIDFYLNHPEVTKKDKKRMEQAIKNGIIKWHGLPVTIHTELMDRRLFEYGLSISNALDLKYNQQTIAAKMTDVPGHSIAIVPLMAQAGLKYLHIGVNASSAIPNVSEMFVWRAKDGSEVIVHYAQDYGETFMHDGWQDMLYFAHSHDNQGPPKDAAEVTELFAELAEEYPGVEVVASSLDEFAKAAWVKKDTLPVIEEEIADSWIHGVASDPKKVADYKILLDLRDTWIESGAMAIDSQEYRDFSEQLMLIAEHTWGGNGNVFLPDYRNYRLADFKKAREKDKITFNHNRNTMDFADLMALISTNIDNKADANRRSYRLYEATWEEQRDYVNKAITALSNGHRKEALEAVDNKRTVIKPLENITEDVVPGKTYQFDGISLVFSTTGGLNQLEINGHNLLKDGKEFGKLSYERFDFANYNNYLSKYSRLTNRTSSWALVDFAKRGIEAYQEIRHEVLVPSIEQSSIKCKGKAVEVNFDLVFKAHEQEQWGVPKKVRLTYQINLIMKEIAGSLKWNDKQANRMPEAYWLETSLTVANPYRWKMSKLNEKLSPYNVVANGNRNIHALTKEGLTYQGIEGNLTINSFDAPLFSFGRRGLLNFDNQQPSLNDGIYVNLYNNTWGTNFPAWFEDDMLFRFGAKLA
ncbi:DUF5054 domain-containing protein [Virgibacillus necropolis]|uniref:Glycoside hydrolase n=1 Tax=Virgibacillus necropolis TaxID=163877 RepID=A0A221MDD1_9BACI|nr:DUF5054 domain-containing protein [Virgibacillus necropolis]ASN05647.1 glycoside hydrolase [Virgibacillus necropolis]